MERSKPVNGKLKIYKNAAPQKIGEAGS